MLLFLTVPWVCLQFVIVVFSGHTHLLFRLKFIINSFTRIQSCKKSIDSRIFSTTNFAHVPTMRGSRNFHQGGGGGGPGQSDKKALTTFFFQSSAYFTEVKWSISKKSIIFQGSRGGPTFSRGGGGFQLFPGGSNSLFPIETHITCDFPGGGVVRTPCPPLWIRTCPQLPQCSK